MLSVLERRQVLHDKNQLRIDLKSAQYPIEQLHRRLFLSGQ